MEKMIIHWELNDLKNKFENNTNLAQTSKHFTFKVTATDFNKK